MSLRENEVIAPLHLRILRIDVHNVLIECRNDFAAGERAARMSGLNRVQHVDQLNAESPAQRLQFCLARICHNFLPIYSLTSSRSFTCAMHSAGLASVGMPVAASIAVVHRAIDPCASTMQS